MEAQHSTRALGLTRLRYLSMRVGPSIVDNKAGRGSLRWRAPTCSRLCPVTSLVTVLRVDAPDWRILGTQVPLLLRPPQFCVIGPSRNQTGFEVCCQARPRFRTPFYCYFFFFHHHHHQRAPHLSRCAKKCMYLRRRRSGVVLAYIRQSCFPDAPDYSMPSTLHASITTACVRESLSQVH